ncbi:hypothetical protein G6F65_021685 [Rhizopus arrhizus]|nr:hypothetical protein G6F65_021685 [Rhizopus arrhizus]
MLVMDFVLADIARLGQMPEARQQIARQGRKILSLVDQAFGFQHLLDMVQVGRPVDLPGVVAVSDDVGQFVLVGEFTGDRLEDVDGRDQAFDGAELVGHQHQLAARTLERGCGAPGLQ